jgi:sulfate adenylyltransferase
MIRPHGGKLIERLAPQPESRGAPRIEISWDTYQDLENIATGVFSPLEGFMCSESYKAVLCDGRLPSGEAWTIPILLHVKKEEWCSLGKGEVASLYFRGEEVAEIQVEDIFQIDKGEYADKIFGTRSESHPGVKEIISSSAFVVGGKINLFKRMKHSFSSFHLTPKETRFLFREKGWSTIVAFQTRNPPHLGHEYVQKTALSVVDGLFINPLIGKKKRGDFKDEVIIETYKTLIENYYPKNRVIMAILSTSMQYAGPREAIFHAIMRKNFGATHIIIGRDHAGVGNFYHPFAAHHIFEKYKDIEIQPIFFASFFRCRRCGEIVNEKICPHPEGERINFSGTSIRKILLSGKYPPKDVMRREVAEIILRHEEPFVNE